MPSLPSHIRAYCGHCSAIVQGKVLGNHAADPDDSGIWTVFSLLACPSCDLAILVSRGVEDFGGEYEYYAVHELYPARHRALGDAAPESVRRAFAEAQDCLRAGAATAAALMCRRAIEEATKSLDQNGRFPLAKVLRALHSEGTLDDRLFEWADALKLAGNDAAHETDAEITLRDAEDLLAFTEAFAEYLFTYRKRFDEYRERRAAARTIQTQPPKAPEAGTP